MMKKGRISTAVKEKAQKIRLVLTDVDGVLTDTGASKIKIQNKRRASK